MESIYLLFYFSTALEKGYYDTVKSFFGKVDFYDHISNVPTLKLIKFLAENNAPLNKQRIFFNAVQTENIPSIKNLVKDGG